MDGDSTRSIKISRASRFLASPNFLSVFVELSLSTFLLLALATPSYPTPLFRATPEQRECDQRFLVES